MRRSIRIAVVGAGLGGLTVAGFLQRAGFSVKVYEQAAAFSRVGAGIHLSSNVMTIMRQLGLERQLVSIGLRPNSFVSRQWDTGEVLFELPLDSKSEAHYGAPYINVHRADLHMILESALAPRTVAFGHQLRALDIVGKTTRLVFANGATAEADIVIGADGVNSKVREHILGAERPRYTGNVAHRSVFPAARLKEQPRHACTKWWGPDSHILVYYMTHTREELYLVSSVPSSNWDGNAAWSPCDREELVAAFDGYHKELRQVVEAAIDVTKWPLLDRDPVDVWSRGSLVLLGDACHPIRPYMAAGAALAIEDAVVLARCIEDLGNDDPAEAFRWFEANRMPRTNKVQQISAANTWLRGPTDVDWLFCYDACSIPLTRPLEKAAGVS